MIRIFLVGLIAFVPDVGGSRLRVVLKDAWGGHHQHVRHLHAPLVLFECKNILPRFLKLPRLPPILIPEPCGLDNKNVLVEKKIFGVTRRFGARVFEHERMSLSGVQPGNNLTFVEERRRPVYRSLVAGFRGDVPRNRFEAEDFSWVPKMSDISPSHATFKEPRAGRLSPEIAALLEIENINARVSTFGLVDLNEEIHSFVFKQLGSQQTLWDDRQALADVVLIEIPFDDVQDDILVMELRGDNGSSRFLRFGLAPEEGNIDIVVGNIAPSITPPMCDSFPAVDEHFEMYYSLTTGPRLPPREADIPFKGAAKSKKINVEYPAPPILGIVELGHCSARQGAGGPRPSSSNRPICTQVVLEPSN